MPASIALEHLPPEGSLPRNAGLDGMRGVCIAAVLVHHAGLGITVLPREMVPAYLTPITEDPDLPPLYDTEIALIEAPGLSQTAHRLAQHIHAALERGA